MMIQPTMEFKIIGHSNNCKELINKKEHLLIGISPFNSRFSKKYIESLLLWSTKEFRNVDVLLPDENTASVLLIASGVEPVKALRKTRKELNRHIRIISDIISSYNFLSNVKIIKFSDYFHNSEYLSIKNKVNKEFDESYLFNKICIDMSMQAVNGRRAGIGQEPINYFTEDTLKTATSYILTELPFYLNSPKILGLNSSILAYHKKWSIGDFLFSNQLSFSINDRQGHGILSII